MVSKRRFLIIVVMMFVLLFMFQFSQIMKESGNQYDENEYIKENDRNADDAWEMSLAKEYAVLIGETDSDIGENVSWWCTYTKRSLKTYDSISQCTEEELKDAQIVLLTSDYVDYDNDMEKLLSLAKQGISFVLCDLPESSVIREKEELRTFLGIDEVRAETVELKGVNLFGGFLLGGQAIYEPKDDKEREERQDLDLSVPWYLTGNGCKTYMVGMLEDESVKNEQLPAMIWRSSVGDGKVFALNGDYMSDVSAIGILDAVMAELNSYEIYPVINAQNLAVSNFPGFAAENEEKMQQLYSRDQKAVFRDVLWPGLCSLIERNNVLLTCYISPQLDYTDDNEPWADQLIFYLKQMKEMRVEAGLSADYMYANGLSDKMEKDEQFFEAAGSEYQYGAAYVAGDQLSEVSEIQKYSRYEGIETVVSNSLGEEPVVSYVSDEITLQSVTNTGISHTYSEDFRMKSLQTALGYSNTVWDMNQISWPQQEEDRWEILFEKFSSNTDTYWKAFDMFEKTTASESDRRVRAFLALDYEDTRKDSTIQLKVENKKSDAWFILRTHGEKISSMTGGDYEEIEEDAYLICAKENELTIQLEKNDDLKYSLP